jgi:acetyl esterase/lipase
MKNKYLLFLVYFTLHACILGQDFKLFLWPDEIPNYRETDEVEKAEATDKLVKISNVQNPDIAVYLPSKGNSTGDAVVICPGGGYWILAYDWEGTDIAKYLNSKGIAGIVLKYRLPVSKSNIEPHLSPLMDAQRAIRITRHNAANWNINPNRIGIMGFSAGGHLASTASTHYDSGNSESSDPIERLSCRPDFTVLIYPVISFQEKYGHSGSRNALLGENPPDELIEYYSNELHVNENTPPTIIIHSQDDEGVSVMNSIDFYKALTDNNVKAEMHLYPYGGHGYSLAIDKGYLSTWPERIVQFINNLE